MPDLVAGTNEILIKGVAGIPPVAAGDDVAELVLAALGRNRLTLQRGDVLVIAQKVVSKAEDRGVLLESVEPTPRAQGIADETGKDPRLVELILQESEAISRLAPGVLIVRHRLGFTSANAGIDRSNVAQQGEGETVLLLPRDPDRSAELIRQRVERESQVPVGVIISDSHGRPFRLGTVGVAIGVAGVPALWDRRGEADLHGYRLQHTDVGLADEIAAAAGLVMGQGAEGIPVVLVRGLKLPPVAGQAGDLVRPPERDLYR